MSELPPEPKALQDLARRPAWIDWPTAFVIALMVLGFPALVVVCHFDGLPLWAGFILGSLLMNLSFTAWHEPSHGNFAKSRTLNNVAGYLASVASVWPGYFARRREHLIHHRYEGQPGKDPVYPRIQVGFFAFPFKVISEAFFGEPWDIPESYIRRTTAHKISDMSSNLISAVIVALSVPFDFWPSLLAVWIAPRILIIGVHAYYICFFPHHVPGGGYTLYRVRRGGGILLRFLTVSQNLHGIHHRWPAIPWHRYTRVVRDHRSEMNTESIEGAPLPEPAQESSP